MSFERNKVAVALACILGVGGAMAVSGALAQAVNPDVPSNTRPDIRVEVTGSNIKRVEGEGALPVTVITRQDIDRTGATTVEQLLQTVSVAVQGNSNLGVASAAGILSSGVSSVSLRGLGSQRTLVLINGRRISAGGVVTDSQTVDVNSIPLAAVERVEVLKDGASAIYGSDAIAGVINFILRKDYTGAEVTVTYGDTQHGGAQSQRVQGAAGWGDLSKDRWNVMVVGSYQKDDALFGRDRRFAKSGIHPDVLNDTSSGNTFPANILALDGSFGTRNPLAPDNCAPSTTSPLFPQTRCRFDPSPFVSLLPQQERGSIIANGTFAITPDIQAYVEGAYARNRVNTVIQPVPLSDQFALPPSHPLFNVAPYFGTNAIHLSASSPFYPLAYVQGLTGGPTPDLDIFYRSFATGLRDVTDTSDLGRFVVGARGTFAGWDFDGGYLHTETKLTEHVNNGYPALTKILPLLNSGQVNLFGPNTPEIQTQIDATQFRDDAFHVKNTIDSFNLKGSRDIWKLPAGPLALAVGAEYRREKFDVDPNPTIQTGDISGYGGNLLPIGVSRHVTGVFAEFNVPIVKTLEGDVAVRYDDYQGTGSTTNPKFSLRWQPTQQILLRAAYGTGFRAPSLSELFQPQITGVTAAGLNDPLRCNRADTNGNVNLDARDCVTQFPIVLGGNPALKPERSDNYSVGVVWEPNTLFSLGLDAFKIKLKDTIIFGVDPNAILADLGAFGALVTRGPVDPNTPGLPGHITNIDQINLNLGETRIRGVDVDFRLHFPRIAVGKFDFTLNGTYFDQYEIQELDGSFRSINGQVNPTVNGLNGVIPRWHHYLSLDWSQGPWAAALANNFQLGYRDIPGTFEDPTDPAFVYRKVGSYSTWDLQGAYSGFKNLKLTLGVKNLFDRDPPYTNAGGQNYFQGGYDPGYADPRGRFFYGSVNYKFK